MKALTVALTATLLAACAGPGPASASDKIVKIGVLNDQKGVNADMSGPNSLVAAEMAVEDSGLRQKGWRIDLNAGDHRNKTDAATNFAIRWADTFKFDMIADTPGFGTALAVSRVAEEKNFVHVNSGGVSSLTSSSCTPNTVTFAYDTYMTERGTAQTVTRTGGDSWFMLTPEHPFNSTMERNIAGYINSAGGTIVGNAEHLPNAPDFAAVLAQARASRAKVIGLVNVSHDTVTEIAQAASFNFPGRGQRLAAFSLFITDVHKLGLATAQGVILTESFYWDLNDRTRAWSRRFQARATNRAMPSMAQAGVYAGTLHYLRALESLGGNPHDGAAVVARMKELPAEDDLFGAAPLRVDGRRAVPAYVFEVKKPSESRGTWDYYKLIAALGPDEVTRPLRSSECSLVRNAAIAALGKPALTFPPLVQAGPQQKSPVFPSTSVLPTTSAQPPIVFTPSQPVVRPSPPIVVTPPPVVPTTRPDLVVATATPAQTAALPGLSPPNAQPLPPDAQSQSQLRRVALVIGNGAYSSVEALPNAAHDAERMAGMFRDAGFDSVTLETNVGVAALRKAVRTFASAATRADIAVVYYAGHGIELGGQNYLVPTDAVLSTDIDVQDETLSLDRVLDLLKPVKRLKLVILDACRRNPFLSQMRSTTSTRAVSRGLARPETTTGNTLVLYAAAENSLASDGDGENSPFTSALLRHLTRPGKDVRIAIGLIHDEVMQATGNQQEPFMYGALGGDNLFLTARAPDSPGR